MNVPRKQCFSLSLFTILAFLNVGRDCKALQVSELDPAAPYSAERRNPVTYEVDFTVVVTPPYKTKLLKVWVPVPQSDFGQEVSAVQMTSFPMEVALQENTEPVFGNRFAYFEFPSPLGAQSIRFQYQVTVWELHWNLDPDNVVFPASWPAGFDKYLQGEPRAVVVDDRFRNVLGEILPEKGNVADDFYRVMSWVQDNFAYDHQIASLQANAVHGLEKRRGHCSDYHSFCASLGRVMGTPTRVTYGINPFPKSSPSHCKLEAFLPPYGWVSFDVSETQKLIASIAKSAELDEGQRKRLIELARQRMAHGFRDNTWYLQTRGTDYELVPPASQRVPVVRTAWIEADGVPLPDPDPSDPDERAFSWMTITRFQPDKAVPYPFADYKTLEDAARPR